MARNSIFIGYRRDDTADVAGRIYDALARRFGRARIFKDVDNIRPGADFGAYIKTVLPNCRVVLVLIGPNWLEARDEAGSRRLDDPHDWVRIEIETALAAPGLDVVPVLVNGARMPRSDELPQSLQPLLRRHAAVIRRDPDFHDDVGRLAVALRVSVRSGVLDLASLGAEPRPRSARAEATHPRAKSGFQVVPVVLILGLLGAVTAALYLPKIMHGPTASAEGPLAEQASTIPSPITRAEKDESKQAELALPVEGPQRPAVPPSSRSSGSLVPIEQPRSPRQVVARSQNPPAPIQVCPQQEFKVYFDWDKTSLGPDAMATIDGTISRVRASPCKVDKVLVRGYSDTDVSFEGGETLSQNSADHYWRRISERRAASVVDALGKRGVAATAITWEGRGIAPGMSPEIHVREPLARRAEVTITFK